MRRILGAVLIAVGLATAWSDAAAQRPTTIPRIGVLIAHERDIEASTNSGLRTYNVQACLAGHQR